MKKVFFSLVAAVAVLVTALSCEKQVTPVDIPDCPEGYYVEVVKALFSSQTKAVVDEQTGKFSWVEGDEVAFHLSDGSYLTAPVNPANGEVRLVIPVGVTRDGYAVYPASAAVSGHASAGDLHVTLPSSYDLSGKLMDCAVEAPMIAVNDADADRLRFLHLGGVMELNITAPAGVEWFSVTVDGAVTGEFAVNEGEEPSISKGSGKSTVTFRLAEGILPSPTSAKVILPVPTGSYSTLNMAYGFGSIQHSTLNRSVSLDFVRSQGKKVNVNAASFSAKSVGQFYLQALEDGSTVSTACYGDVTDAEVYVSIDDKATWQKLGSTPLSVPTGVRAYMVGLRSSVSDSEGNGFTIKGTGSLKAGGKIMTLTSASSTIQPYHFYGVFRGNEGLSEANSITFPVLALQEYSFARAFEGCTKLTKTGIMPGKSLAPYCFSGMYRGCTSLATAPKLSTSALAEGCYEYLFEGCTGFTASPDLLVATPVKYCYRGIFKDCSNLKEITCALSSWGEATVGWVEGVAAKGRFIGPQALDMTIQDDSHVPTGWDAFYDDSLNIEM